MYNLFFRSVAAASFLLAVLITGCDPAGGPTSALEDGDSSEWASSELAFGKRPVFEGTEGDLVAGQTMVVGTVNVTDEGDNKIRVHYNITDPAWCITETHVYVGDNPPDKAAPGQFPYGDDNLDCVDTWSTGLIDVSGFPVVIAAHAVVETVAFTDVDTDALTQSWVNPVGVNVGHPGAASYFDVSVSDWGALSGDYPGWCVDTDLNIRPGDDHFANAFSSYDPAVQGLGLVENPENLDLVNYILNQVYVGEPSGIPFENYTMGDVQRAIWQLLDDEQSVGGLGPWSQARSNEIVADAEANGEGFYPECGGFYGVILQPFKVDNQVARQIMIIPLPVPCERGDETAWGWGSVTGNSDITKFSEGWGWHFEWTP